MSISNPVVGESVRVRPGRVLGVMCAGMFLVLLDVTIVNVALPSIGHGLRSDVSMLQWVVDGYVVAIAGLLLAGGTVGDRIGHRRVLLTGFAVFGIASLVCALAPDIGVLIGARIVQGVGGALLLPGTMAVIVEVFPDRGAQARALGTWAAISSLALPAGPLLGGLLTGWFGWRPVFWINVPLTVLVILATLRTVPHRPGVARERIDLVGLTGFVLGLGGLVFTVISIGHHAGWPTITAAAVVTIAALTTALLSSARSTNPVLPLDLLRHKDFLSPNLVALTMNLIFNGLLFVTSLYLQDVLGYSPLSSGLAVLPLAVPLVVLAPVSGRITARRGPRTAVALGCVLAILGTLLLTRLQADGGIGWLLTGFGVLGCGAGLITASVVAAVVRATPADRSGLATGTSNTARQIGTATGVAVFGAVAGSPASGHFVHSIHLLAVASAIACATALVVTGYGVAGRPADH
ncbi:MFS transporter [Nocardia macrotermitis]|uniref:Multidrug resistance protein Stp n=1 Tax=Nocardia macrotermitis TaxID=2585198 RepID=A0A7K0CVW2_9NOCA|nr:MFS transporter [Nocardia macrotermitis]MQY17541.1 Multidrug resistance protein Stp [Nocardia macrotermitis]